MDIQKYWQAVIKQDADCIADFFRAAATIYWHNTNEQFTVKQFVEVNCKYPDKWCGDIKKVIALENMIITVVNVYNLSHTVSHHVTSFFTLSNDKIEQLDEYWGEDGQAPEWRQKLLLCQNDR